MMIKIERDKHDKQIYINFTEDFFMHFINEWSQLKGKWNWFSFTLIQIYFENEVMTGGYEFMFIILGLGFRIRYNYSNEWHKKYDKEIEEALKENKEKK